VVRDLATWLFGALIVVGGGYLFWREVLTKGHADVGVIRRRFRPDPPPPITPPVVVVGHPYYSYSTTSINERTLTKRAYLTRLEIGYSIENKEGVLTVTDVVTGVRRRDDGREHQDPGFRGAAIAPREAAPVRAYELPLELFDGLEERDHDGAFLVWARYTSPDEHRCEEIYDPVSRDHVRKALDAGV
jgi:hypothetical protein